MDPLFCVKDKVAIITGASRGLGLSYARALASRGARVAICGHSLERLRQAEEELAREGLAVFARSADVSDENSVKEFVQAVLDRFGRIDILVNNAGVLLRRAPEETSVQDWESIMQTNVKGTFLFSREAGAVMQRQGGGSIINISSIGARCALSRRLAYCTSKAAVEQFTRTLAFEWSTYCIRVNAIAPGYVESDMNADLRADPERVQEILADVPMGRFGHPEDLHGALLFLCSDASAFVTGQILYVDGGKTAH